MMGVNVQHTHIHTHEKTELHQVFQLKNLSSLVHVTWQTCSVSVYVRFGFEACLILAESCESDVTVRSVFVQGHKIATVERVRGQPSSVCVFLARPWTPSSTFSRPVGEKNIAEIYIHFAEVVAESFQFLCFYDAKIIEKRLLHQSNG